MSDSGSPIKKQSKEEDVRVHLCGEEHKKSEIKKENAEASPNTIHIHRHKILKCNDQDQLIRGLFWTSVASAIG